MIMPMLAVKDVDASIAFYKDVLGFETQMALPDATGKNVFAIIMLGSDNIGLGARDIENPGQGVGFMVYIPEANDLDVLYASVLAKGITPTMELKTEYWGDRLFEVKDPDGYLISMCKTVEQANMDVISAMFRGEHVQE